MKILVGSVVKQDKDVLAAHAKTVQWQELREDHEIEIVYISDGQPFDQLSWCTHVWEAEPKPQDAQYEVAEETHHWSEPTFGWLGRQKQRLLDYAKDREFDYVWLVDSDLLLGPETLQTLLDGNKSIVSAVFWTQWSPDSPLQPQVWLAHPYSLTGWRYSEQEFLERLSKRELIPVKGLGACTLIDVDVLDYVRYWPFLDGLPNGGMWQGEDRHFCVGAARNHIDLWADAWPDIYHCYRPSDRQNLAVVLETLSAPRIESASIGHYVSFTVEPLEEPNLLNYKVHVRGRLGQLKLAPEIEYELYDMGVGDECIQNITYPPWFNIEGYAGLTRAVRIKLLDVKPWVPHIGLPFVESSYADRLYSQPIVKAMR